MNCLTFSCSLVAASDIPHRMICGGVAWQSSHLSRPQQSSFNSSFNSFGFTKYLLLPYRNYGVRLESFRLDVCSTSDANGRRDLTSCSYNRYLAVAARVVRRSLKEEQRLKAERRGEMDLRFAKWSVSLWNTLDLRFELTQVRIEWQAGGE